MTTPAARALQKLSSRVSDAPIYNFLAREARLSAFAVKLSEKGIRTVRDFVLASETAVLSSIRTTPDNRKKVERILRLFGVERPVRVVRARRTLRNGTKPS
jgi:hypothetical protein